MLSWFYAVSFAHLIVRLTLAWEALAACPILVGRFNRMLHHKLGVVSRQLETNDTKPSLS
jgi:hypothetical protein